MLSSGQEKIALYFLAAGELLSWLPSRLFLQAFLLTYNLVFLALYERDAYGNNHNS